MTFGPGDTLLYLPNHIHPRMKASKRRGCILWSPDTERNHLPLSPRDPGEVRQKGDSNDNGKGGGAACFLSSHVVRTTTSVANQPSGQPGWLYAEVHGVRATHGFSLAPCTTREERRGLVAGTLQFSLPASARNVIRAPAVAINTERSVRPPAEGMAWPCTSQPITTNQPVSTLKSRLVFP